METGSRQVRRRFFPSPFTGWPNQTSVAVESRTSSEDAPSLRDITGVILRQWQTFSSSMTISSGSTLLPGHPNIRTTLRARTPPTLPSPSLDLGPLVPPGSRRGSVVNKKSLLGLVPVQGKYHGLDCYVSPERVFPRCRRRPCSHTKSGRHSCHRNRFVYGQEKASFLFCHRLIHIKNVKVS